MLRRWSERSRGEWTMGIASIVALFSCGQAANCTGWPHLAFSSQCMPARPHLCLCQDLGLELLGHAWAAHIHSGRVGHLRERHRGAGGHGGRGGRVHQSSTKRVVHRCTARTLWHNA